MSCYSGLDIYDEIFICEKISKKFSPKKIFHQKKNFHQKKFSPKKISSYWFYKIYSTSKFYKRMLN